MKRRLRKTTHVVERRLRAVAIEQLQVLSSENLRSIGVHRSAASRRVRTGEWHRITKGVYRIVTSGHQTSLEQQMIAATLAAPEAVIIGWFAAHIHGLPVMAELQHLLVTVALPSDRRSTVMRARRFSGPLPSRPWQTGRVATPVLTIVTLASGGASCAQLETVLDAALTRRLVTVHRIEELLLKPGWLRFRGRSVLVSLLQARSGGRALFRSRTEEKVHRWITQSALPKGVPNHRASTSMGDVEVDVAWPKQRVALEISPFWNHGSRAKQERDIDRRQALVASGWRIIEAYDRHLVDRRSFQPILELLEGLIEG
jgi:very-short-patch-repair endonuclease